MTKFSTEYTAVIAMFLVPLLSKYLTATSASEVSQLVATLIVSGVGALYLMYKRYTRGGVTPLGVRKKEL